MLNSASADELMTALDTDLPVREDTRGIASTASPNITDSDWLLPPITGPRKSAADSGDRDLRIRDFYRRRHPVIAKRIPKSTDGERIFWKLGEVIQNFDLTQGEYSILRISDRSTGFHLRWIGKLRSDGQDATITQANEEIKEGDALVKELFEVYIPEKNDPRMRNIASEDSPSKREKVVGIVQSFIEPEQNEKIFFTGDRHLLAAQFGRYTGGNSTTIGATFKVMRGPREIAQAIVVDSDLDLATLYVLKANGEVRSGDTLVP